MEHCDLLDIMSCRMDYCEKQHGIGYLPVKPQILIQRQPSNLGTNPPHEGAADGYQYESAIKGQNQTSAA